MKRVNTGCYKETKTTNETFNGKTSKVTVECYVYKADNGKDWSFSIENIESKDFYSSNEDLYISKKEAVEVLDNCLLTGFKYYEQLGWALVV